MIMILLLGLTYFPEPYETFGKAFLFTKLKKNRAI
jgi:hypothetical protein